MKKLTLLFIGVAVMAMLPSHTLAATNVVVTPVPVVPPPDPGDPNDPGDGGGGNNPGGNPPGGNPGGPSGPSNVNQGNSISVGDTKDMKDAKSLVYPVEEGYWDIFVIGSGAYDDVGKASDPAHFYSLGEAGHIGAEYHFPTDWSVGLSLGYGHTDFNFGNANASSTQDSYNATLFAAYSHDGWFADGNITGGYDTFTEDAVGGNSIVPSLGPVAIHGATDGFNYGGHLSGGKLFQDGDWSFGPLVGATYSRTFVSGFTQSTPAAFSGSSFTSAQSQSLTSLVAGLVRYQAQIGSVTVLPYLSLGWQHEFLDTGITANGTNLATGASFSTTSAKLDRDAAAIHLGASAYLTDKVTVFVDYGNEVNATYVDQTVNGGVSYSF